MLKFFAKMFYKTAYVCVLLFSLCAFIECTDIKTSTACEWKSATLECAVGDVILVKSANYGRTDDQTCATDAMYDRNCTARNSLSIVSQSCNNKQRCNIYASNGVFGDPCVGTNKYLTVQYQCISDIKTSTACEWKSATLECAVGDVILVKSANYGRTDDQTCATDAMYDTNCTARNSLSIVSQSCNNKQRCNIYASNGVFGDPCVATNKYLTVQYQCILVATCKAEEFQCNNGKCIPESSVSDGFNDCSSGEDEQDRDYESSFACEGHTLNLYCKRDEIISIISANYGRLSPKICTHDLMGNQNCRASTSLQVVKERCNEKGFCSVPSTNQVFGDPCVNTYKYTEVHYECIRKATCTENEFQCSHGHCIDATLRCDGKWDCTNGEDESACSYLTEVACEHSTLTIECKKDHVIKIIGANYGRQMSHICNYQTTLNCLAPVSKTKVKNMCNGKKGCTISASNAEFGDPCVGIMKYLSVNYNCVNSKENDIAPNDV